MAICSVAWPIFLDFYFYAYSPNSPDPLNGFIYPVNVHHGAKVYLNSKQWFWFSPTVVNIYYMFGALTGILGSILYQRWHKKVMPGRNN